MAEFNLDFLDIAYVGTQKNILEATSRYSHEGRQKKKMDHLYKSVI